MHDAVHGEEGVLRVSDLCEDVQALINQGGPDEVEAMHQGDDLEVVCQDSNEHCLRLVPLWIREQVAMRVKKVRSYKRI